VLGFGHFNPQPYPDSGTEGFVKREPPDFPAESDDTRDFGSEEQSGISTLRCFCFFIENYSRKRRSNFRALRLPIPSKMTRRTVANDGGRERTTPRRRVVPKGRAPVVLFFNWALCHEHPDRLLVDCLLAVDTHMGLIWRTHSYNVPSGCRDV